VNDAWRLPRRARLTIDYGGIYFQLLTVLLLSGVALVMPAPAVLSAILLIDTIMVMALMVARWSASSVRTGVGKGSRARARTGGVSSTTITASRMALTSSP
jgi:hypothetical protein